MEEINSKELKNIKEGDALIRMSDNRAYKVSQILTDSEEDAGVFTKASKYFYFSDLGSSVKDKVMRKMFKMKHDKFVIAD